MFPFTTLKVVSGYKFDLVNIIFKSELSKVKYVVFKITEEKKKIRKNLNFHLKPIFNKIDFVVFYVSKKKVCKSYF